MHAASTATTRTRLTTAGAETTGPRGPVVVVSTSRSMNLPARHQKGENPTIETGAGPMFGTGARHYAPPVAIRLVLAEDNVLVREGARSVIDPKVVDALMAARLAGRSPLAALTPRERETLAEMAQGKTNAAIGEALVLSDRAVEKHINAVFTKLDLGPETDGHRRVKAVLLYLADSGRLGEPAT